MPENTQQPTDGLDTPSAPAADGSIANHTPYDPPKGPLRIVHEAERFVVLDKPSGLLSVPGRGDHKHDSLKTRFLERFPESTGSVTVHRLDMDTSGCTVLARDPETHARLSRQFMHRKTKKTYSAVLCGHPAPEVPEEGCIDLPLIVDWPNRPRHMVDFERGKHAKTYYTILDRMDKHPDAPGVGPVTRVSFRPITGRTHQLRLHAAQPAQMTEEGNRGGLGMPIVGDTLYSTSHEHAERLMLHADLLCFWNPWGQDWLRFESAAPF